MAFQQLQKYCINYECAVYKKKWIKIVIDKKNEYYLPSNANKAQRNALKLVEWVNLAPEALSSEKDGRIKDKNVSTKINEYSVVVTLHKNNTNLLVSAKS